MIPGGPIGTHRKNSSKLIRLFRRNRVELMQIFLPRARVQVFFAEYQYITMFLQIWILNPHTKFVTSLRNVKYETETKGKTKYYQ